MQWSMDKFYQKFLLSRFTKNAKNQFSFARLSLQYRNKMVRNYIRKYVKVIILCKKPLICDKRQFKTNQKKQSEKKRTNCTILGSRTGHLSKLGLLSSSTTLRISGSTKGSFGHLMKQCSLGLTCLSSFEISRRTSELK